MSEDMDIPNLDKIAHIVVFAIFVGSWCFYFKSRLLPFTQLKLAFFLVFLFACFNGIIVEYIQKFFVSNRSFDTGDILADVLSSGISYGICNVMLLNESRNNSTESTLQHEKVLTHK